MFFRSMPATIEFVRSEELLYFRKRQLRENLLNDFESAALTAYAEVFDVAEFKELRRASSWW